VATKKVYRVIVHSLAETLQFWYDIDEPEKANQVASDYATGLMGKEKTQDDSGAYVSKQYRVEVVHEDESVTRKNCAPLSLFPPGSIPQK
jgi:hypothetical protein